MTGEASEGGLSSRAPTVVVTGASGYLASVLIPRLAANHCALRLVSRADVERSDPVLPSYGGQKILGDLSAENTWTRLIEGADAVVHLSCRTDAAAAEADPAEDDLLNVQPVRALVKAASSERRRPLVVIFASTVTIVGPHHSNPVDENTPDRPSSIYDEHKLVCERMLAEATEAGMLRACSLRLSNVYGYGNTSVNRSRGVLNQMIRRAVCGESITLYGSGQYTRDFIHVDDVVDAICAVLAAPQSITGKHYVVATGVGTPLERAFELIKCNAEALVGRPVEIKRVNEPADIHPIERRNFIGNSARLRAETGWAPRISLNSGIARALRQIAAEPTSVRE